MIEATAATPDASAEAPAKPFMPTRGATDDWCSPPEIVDVVRRIFGGRIDLDPCSNPWSVVGADREIMLPSWSEEVDRRDDLGAREREGHILYADGLNFPWLGNVFVNPPYGRALDGFMGRARRAGVGNEWGAAHVIMLVASKTSRKCWQTTVPAARAVCFVDGRLEYVLKDGTKSGAWFSSALILWTRDVELAHRFAWFLDGKIGHVMSPR